MHVQQSRLCSWLFLFVTRGCEYCFFFLDLLVVQLIKQFHLDTVAVTDVGPRLQDADTSMVGKRLIFACSFLLRSKALTLNVKVEVSVIYILQVVALFLGLIADSFAVIFRKL